MEWASTQTVEGQILTGVIKDGMLHPHIAFGVDDPAFD